MRMATIPKVYGSLPTRSKMPQSQIAVNLLQIPKEWQPKKPVCQCECRKVGVGVCNDAPVGSHDPGGLLCNLCYFELTKMKGIRKYEACNYPPQVPSRSSSTESRRSKERDLSFWAP
ncbi:hypothetical protein GGR53DRAFT_116076 [Hypoxylon sp. FL1150]|nr:hypothetical protein GGR53DRAFT_116076 [Hypoxylon sp. FL1150]